MVLSPSCTFEPPGGSQTLQLTPNIWEGLCILLFEVPLPQCLLSTVKVVNTYPSPSTTSSFGNWGNRKGAKLIYIRHEPLVLWLVDAGAASPWKSEVLDFAVSLTPFPHDPRPRFGGSAEPL